MEDADLVDAGDGDVGDVDESCWCSSGKHTKKKKMKCLLRQKTVQTSYCCCCCKNRAEHVVGDNCHSRNCDQQMMMMRLPVQTMFQNLL